MAQQAPQGQASYDPWAAVIGGLSDVFKTLTHDKQSAYESGSAPSRTAAGGSAPRNAPSNAPTLALATHGPISSFSKSTACSFFEPMTPRNPDGPPCVNLLDRSAGSILDVAFALGGCITPSEPKPRRRVKFERTQHVILIPSRHSIPYAEKDRQWYTQSDFRNFAQREQARRDRGGISFEEQPSHTESPTTSVSFRRPRRARRRRGCS